MKNIIAVNIGKSISLGLKLCKFGSGTSMPGIIAQKISPKILSDLINQTKKEIIAVTGTNGKTTTANFISAILKSAGRKVATNDKGANMLTGITTAMIENANNFAKLNVDNSVLESDEAYLKIFADYFSADFVLVTNLFQDQLDRYGAVDTTAKIIKIAINKFKAQSDKFTTVLNADNPTLGVLSDEKTVFFGFDDIKFNFEYIQTQATKAICNCGKHLKYSKVFYDNTGHYTCDCGFKRPKTYLKAIAQIHVDYSILNIINPATNETFDVKVNMPGIYNAYNALGAITLAAKIGINSKAIQNAFSNYKTIFGRAENSILKGKNTITQLIKNPVGAAEVLKTVRNDENARICIAINDNFGDGRDVSWLWDTDFEMLKGHDKKIFISGLRCLDLALRLKYAGIKEENIIYNSDFEQTVLQALEDVKANEKLYILPCYTALLDMQKFIKQL